MGYGRVTGGERKGVEDTKGKKRKKEGKKEELSKVHKDLNPKISISVDGEEQLNEKESKKVEDN